LSYYTWSKSIDNYPSVGNGSSGGSGSTNFQDSANATGEKGVANYDQPSTFKAGYTYQLPIGPGKSLNINNRFLYMLAGGFSTSGIATVASGFPNYITLGTAGYFQSQPLPANPTSGTLGAPTSALPDGDVLRPNIVPGVPLINPNWRRDPFGLNGGGYLNPRAFTTPGSVGNPQFGNAPRTLTDARSPRELLFDMGVRKNFPLKNERYRFEINANFLNAFNHPVFFGVNSHAVYSAFTPTGPNPVAPVQTVNFGALNSGQTASLSRVIQIGGRLSF
jgi:hypothetical protein